jgi:hypothetical protein
MRKETIINISKLGIGKAPLDPEEEKGLAQKNMIPENHHPDKG